MQDTIIARALPASASPALRYGIPLLAGVALLTASAKLQIPFWPVPMTLQTLAVLLIGATCGARLGLATVAAYLALGFAGAPIFATGGGPAYLAGPTAGYLFGFAAAAFVVGQLSARGAGQSLGGIIAALLIGEVLIFGPGVLWLSSLVGIEKAVGVGLVPFLPAELLKVALAATLWIALARNGRG